MCVTLTSGFSRNTKLRIAGEEERERKREDALVAVSEL